MEIRKYESKLLSSNMYVVVEGDRAVVIDPFENIEPVKGLQTECILLTHEHYDHISGVNLWKKETNVPVICSNACAANICNPKKNLAQYFRTFCELQTWANADEVPPYDPEYRCQADDVFTDRQEYGWLGHKWQLFELPGHSPGSIGILLDGENFFSGDSLIKNFKANFGAPGGSRKQWETISVPRLRHISEGIRVYPGHFGGFIYDVNELLYWP
ncbi:MAG: MBL fold metallo-hydrolase [Lachnospiraceae bacterium]|nr:MBL fold metallo-hydrolase [Lachnospiraceae bacterium]